MDLEQGDIEKFQEAINKFGLLMDKLPNGSSNSTINVQAGGVGLWIAVTCCIAAFTMALACAVGVGFALYKTDKMSDYLAAIYMQAPQLKPQETKDDDHHNHAAADKRPSASCSAEEWCKN